MFAISLLIILLVVCRKRLSFYINQMFAVNLKHCQGLLLNIEEHIQDLGNIYLLYLVSFQLSYVGVSLCKGMEIFNL